MSSTISVQCPTCNAKIKAPVELLGQKRKCPRCRARVEIARSKPIDASPKVLLGDEGSEELYSTTEHMIALPQ